MIPLQWLTGCSSICDSHESTHASKETSELKGCGTLSRAVRGTFEKIVDLAIFEFDIVSLCVESQISLFLEFL